MTSQHTQRHQQSGRGDGREDFLAAAVPGNGGVGHRGGAGVHLEDGAGHHERHPAHRGLVDAVLYGEMRLNVVL